MINVILKFNNIVVFNTRNGQPVKSITFQTPVLSTLGVQLEIQYQLDPTVFQGNIVRFNADAAKICASPTIRVGMLTNADERETIRDIPLMSILDRVKTYSLA